jgi:hypothetical protein
VTDTVGRCGYCAAEPESAIEARVRAQVAAEIAEAIERNMAAHAWECAAIARQHAAPSGSPGNPKEPTDG